MSRRTEKRAQDLEAVLHPVTPSAVRDRLAKSARIAFQLAPAEKREIAETASAFGLTVTDYLLRLHRLTVAIQGRHRK
jgi:hypothetical protein